MLYQLRAAGLIPWAVHNQQNLFLRFCRFFTAVLILSPRIFWIESNVLLRFAGIE